MLPKKTLFAFALEREARPFRRECPLARIIITGVGPTRATDAIAKAIQEQRPNAVVMSGFAGALSDDLHVGDIVMATDVYFNSPPSQGGVGEGFIAATAIVSNLDIHVEQKQSLHGRILSVDCIIGSPAEKRSLALRHQAIAVDMESAAVAQMCDDNNIPWVAVRVISDRVDTALSPELIELLNGGSVSVLQTMRAVLRQPSLLLEFRRLARDTRLAAQRLAEFLGDRVRD